MNLIRRLITAYYSRFASCKPVKLNPTKWERFVKFWRVTIQQMRADVKQSLLLLLSIILMCVWWFQLVGA